MSDTEDPRRRQILDAAAELFLRDGYDATSIDAIIAQAGGSKTTIYALFGNKLGLYKALMQENNRNLFDGLEPEQGEAMDLEASLTSFAENLLTMLAQPRAVSTFRMAVSELHRLPQLARSFNELGPARGHQWVTGVLKAAQERGEIETPDPARSAHQFLGLVRGNEYFETILGLREPPDQTVIHEQAREATQMFLNHLRRG